MLKFFAIVVCFAVGTVCASQTSVVIETPTLLPAEIGLLNDKLKEQYVVQTFEDEKVGPLPKWNTPRQIGTMVRGWTCDRIVHAINRRHPTPEVPQKLKQKTNGGCWSNRVELTADEVAAIFSRSNKTDHGVREKDHYVHAVLYIDERSREILIRYQVQTVDDLLVVLEGSVSGRINDKLRRIEELKCHESVSSANIVLNVENIPCKELAEGGYDWGFILRYWQDGVDYELERYCRLNSSMGIEKQEN